MTCMIRSHVANTPTAAADWTVWYFGIDILVFASGQRFLIFEIFNVFSQSYNMSFRSGWKLWELLYMSAIAYWVIKIWPNAN